MSKKYTHKPDPYHYLTFVIGSEDDFVCFDYAVSTDRSTVKIASTINSETGGFIQEFMPTVEVPREAASLAARGLVDAALDWCGENEVEHDIIGWNQEPEFLIRSIQGEVGA